MSLSRLALRLAAVEALCPSAVAASGPWPTFAGSEVYDSAIVPITDATAWSAYVERAQGKPIVTVYTEEQETTPTAGEYGADLELVDLVVEIMIVARSIVSVVGQDGTPEDIGSIETPITSSQHEATLDMLEAQIRALLDPESQACPTPYSAVARELHHVKSVPMRDAADRLSRQAARTLTLKLRVAHAQPFPAAPGGFPEPLATVAAAIDPASAAGQLLTQLLSGVPAAPTLTALDDIHAYSSLDRCAVPTADAPDLESDAPLS